MYIAITVIIVVEKGASRSLYMFVGKFMRRCPLNRHGTSCSG